MEWWKNISQEEFDKLPQLDRIELRQKRDFLKEEYKEMGFFSFLNTIIKWAAYLFLLSFVLFDVSPEASFNILNIIPFVFRVGLIICLFLTIGDIILKINHNKKMNKLYLEYFKQETRVNKK